MHQAERAAREEVGGRINVAGVFGAERESGVCEAVRGDMWEGRREDARFLDTEGARWWRVVVGMVKSVVVSGQFEGSRS